MKIKSYSVTGISQVLERDHRNEMERKERKEKKGNKK